MNQTENTGSIALIEDEQNILLRSDCSYSMILRAKALAQLMVESRPTGLNPMVLAIENYVMEGTDPLDEPLTIKLNDRKLHNEYQLEEINSLCRAIFLHFGLATEEETIDVTLTIEHEMGLTTGISLQVDTFVIEKDDEEEEEEENSDEEDDDSDDEDDESDEEEDDEDDQ